MASITHKIDITDIVERLRTVAEALKRMPGDYSCCPEEMEGLCKEVRAIAAKIRGN